MSITILPHDPRWKGLGPTVRRAVEAALRHQRINHVAVTVVLTDDAEIRTLNHTYRAKSKPTNVLAFPDGAEENGIRQLGDIVMSYDTIRTEASVQEKSLKAHISHLAVHGTLHLLGYDHGSEHEANIMESHEIAILACMAIANPYESS